MVKRIWLVFLMIFLCFSTQASVWAEDENDFWAACNQGEYDKAGDLAKELAVNNPAYYGLAAICYQNALDYDQFRIYHQKFQKLAGPDNLKTLFTEKQNETPDDPQLLLFQGLAALILPEAQLGDAGTFLQKAAVKLGDNPYISNYQAIYEMNKHNYSATVQKYLQKAIAMKKNYPEPYIHWAEVLTQNKETDKAINVLLDCFNNCPQVPDTVYQSLANLISSPVTNTIKPYGQQMIVSVPNIKETYRTKIKTALTKTPMHLEALAEFFAVKGNTSVARYLMSDPVSTVDNRGECEYLQLQIANFEGDFAQSVMIGKALLDKNDLTYQKLYETGNVLFYGKEFQSAIAFYEEALKIINPDDDEFIVKIHTNLGICLYLTQDYQNALSYFEKVLTMNPQDVNSLVYSGLAYRDLGDKEKALANLTKALDYIPDTDWRQEITDIVNQLKPEDK